MTCICLEPKCSGCDCGSDCAFAPGHEQGTGAIDPLDALIEAIGPVIDHLHSTGYDIDEESGYITPDIRRVNATIGWIISQQQRNEKGL